MKRNSFFLVIILLLSMIFISCSAEPSSNNTGVAKVAISATKELSVDTAITELPKIDDLYVFYTAYKVSDGFRTGETTGITPIRTDNDGKGLPKVIGQTGATFNENGVVPQSDTWFSTGTWEFSFYAVTTSTYDEEKVVFRAVDVSVEITRPEDESDNIGGYAEIALEIYHDTRLDAEVYVSGVYADFGNSFDSSATYKMSVTVDEEETPVAVITGTSDSNGRVTFTAAGVVKSFSGMEDELVVNHTLSFKVTKDTDSLEYASGSLSIPTKKGYKDTISGDLDNLESVAMVAINLDLSKDIVNGTISSKTEFTGSSESAVVAVVSDVAPDMTNAENKTTVTFVSSDISTDSNVSYSLNVEVTTAALGDNSEAFEVISTDEATNKVESSIAEIDLTLTKRTTTTSGNDTTYTDEPVTQFESSVTVETFVEPGLENVKVYYKGNNGLEEMSDATYDSATGKITFTTNHFSKYIVSTDANLLIMNNFTGKKYKSLQFAIDEANSIEEIVLLGNITLTETVTVSKDINLSLGDYNITANNARALWVTDGLLTLTGNGTVKTEGTGISSSSSVIRVGSAEAKDGSAGLVINKDVTISSNHCYGVTVFGKNTEGQTLDVKGTVSVTGEVSAISGNGSAGLTTTDITIRDGAVVSSENKVAIYHPQDGTLNIEGGEITGKGGVEVKGGTVIISGGTITATATETSHVANGNGPSTEGYAVVAVENSGYKGDATIEITGGTITGAIGVKKDSESEAFDAKLSIKGGVFNTDPTDFVASGYCVKHDEVYDVAAHTPGNTHGVPVEGIDGYKHTPYCDHCGTLMEGTEADCVNDQGHCAICGQQMTVSIALTLEFDAAGTLSITNPASKNLQYSINGSETRTAFPSGGLSVSANDIVQLYSDGTGSADGTDKQMIISCTSDCVVYGNVMSLVDPDNFADLTSLSDTYTFFKLFSGNTHIRFGSNKLVLPATTLSRSCYQEMFSGCTAITSAPELPAMTLASECYRGMFTNCTSLVTAPVLPATVLQSSCYYSMFMGCTSLVTAPQIEHVTSMARACFMSMFSGCVNLAEAPQLPAITDLSNCMWCYSSMFQRCTKITTVPSNLSNVEKFAAYSCSNMFEGCTSLTAALALNATKLADASYNCMFKNCTSLTTAMDILPAESLTTHCYREMFSGCTSLTNAPKLPSMSLGSLCYCEMFADCTSLTEAPDLPAVVLKDFCYQEMFRGCTSLTKAPSELPAPNLLDACYYKMFYGCSSLNSVVCLAVSGFDDTVVSNGVTKYTTEDMMTGVASSGTFTKARAASWPSGNKGIPSGWDKNTYSDGPLTLEPMTSGTATKITVTYTSSTAPNGLSYSINGGDAVNIESSPMVIEANRGDKVSFFANRGSITESDGLNIACDKSCYVYGNVMSLIAGNDYATATTLPQYAFYQLFKNDSNRYKIYSLDSKDLLLPAKTLTNYCYYEMFINCGYNFKSIACSATNISATECLTYWFSGTSYSGTFYKEETATWPTASYKNNYCGSPEGWTVKNL